MAAKRTKPQRTRTPKPVNRHKLMVNYNGAKVTIEGTEFQVNILARRILQLEPA